MEDGTTLPWSLDFDEWRRQYDEMTFEQHQLFYELIFQHYPDQRKADREHVCDAMTQVMAAAGGPIKVVEIGGWDGALAWHMICDCADGLELWENYEICESAANKGFYGIITNSDQYMTPTLRDWPWKEGAIGDYRDLAVMSHVIEHLSWEHLQKLLTALSHVPYMYIQAPASLADYPHKTLWMGTKSTHKLEVGWAEIGQYMRNLGYQIKWVKGNQSRFYEKVGE